MKSLSRILLVASLGLALLSPARAEVNNVKVVTDASPDYSDMDSMIHSIAGKWQTDEDKLWAMFYWNHIARRQTSPMSLHGTALTDPIRQFNDYGYTMCSTISGINCAIWDAMGYKVKYWDVTNHTVAEVEYGGKWHMYDNSLSALYTLCDGRTIAGVEDIGATLGCEASGGKVEKGHIAKYHSLTATSKNGFLTGSDTIRSVEDEVRVFNPNGLKYRYYFYDWDRGHRYILNLRDGEAYTRHYKNQGDTAEFYVANNGKNPEDKRFNQRGNGVRTFKPALTAATLPKIVHSMTNVTALDPAGVAPIKAGEAGEVVFKVEGANVITSLAIKAAFERKNGTEANTIAVSTTNGLTWKEVWTNDKPGATPVDLKLVAEVNGSYEVLVKVTLRNSVLKDIEFETTTMLNAKTQPRLNVGKNTVYVGTGEQTGSIVFWPDLQGDNAKPYIVEQENVTFQKENPGYQGTLHATKAGEDAYVVFKMDAPGDITRLNYGGRLYNRAPKSHIDFLHSFDGGKTWTKSYSLSDTKPPWDVIHYATVDNVPAGTRSVLFKYLLNGSDAGKSACSIYAVRMEANHKTADATFKPLEVTFNWSERQQDYSLVERSHMQLVRQAPFKYTINVGGADHPVVNSLRINVQGAVPDVKYGYSDGKEGAGEKFVPRWITVGKNLAEGKSYTLSVPSDTTWDAGDPDGKKLTDGIVGPTFSGGTSYRYGAIWGPNKNPVITLDLGAPTRAASFGMNFHGYQWHDALKGQVKDKVEVLVSNDGQNYNSLGFLHTDLRRKDIPINFMLPDDESLSGTTFRLIPAKPVETRYVQYKVTSKRNFDATELEVLDSIDYKPYDLRLALPDEGTPGNGVQPKVLSAAGRPIAAEQAAKNAAKPVGEPGLDAPTLHSLGVYWIVGGDDNKDAKVEVAYRAAGATAWQPGPPLFRVEKDAHKNEKGQSKLNVPADAWLFAGSVVLLEPDTDYELKLSLADPDGGKTETVLKSRTRAEPVVAATAPQFHVVPGSGGGLGTADNPYRGLTAAQDRARPGHVFLLHVGTYEGTFQVRKSGTPGRPIVWRAAGDGTVTIDAGGKADKRPGRAISASDVQDVWFEGLTIRNADYALVGHNSARIVVRRCQMRDVEYGITCTNNDKDTVQGWFISDNTIEGPSTWPRTKGIENARAIQVTGTGHDVCYNRIRGFADAINTFGSQRCEAIDFHHNEISEMTDDGVELDYSVRNTRCFLNRFTNVFQGISVQPIHGGPVYIFRNAIYNVVGEPFKMHNSPSGALMLHNTSVKKGMPLVLYSNAKVRNCVFRNNIFIGTTAGYAFESTAPMVDCDFDYDGFGGGPFEKFLKWNTVRYETFDDMKNKAPVEQHATLVDPATAFAGGVKPPADETRAVDRIVNDLRLKAGTAALDAGTALPGFNDSFSGKAPDLGAYEFGAAWPGYGPRSIR